jgi:hypothetical protein
MVVSGVRRVQVVRQGKGVCGKASEVCKNDREQGRIEVGTRLICSAF